MTDRLRLGSLLSRPKLRSRIVAILWVAAALATVVRIAAMLADPSLPGEDWRTSDGNLEDFRDIIWVPGRYVLDGGNPYDPGPYLAAHPWAQEFDPYAPAWLLLAVLLAPLPFLLSAAIFQLLSTAVAILMLRVLCGWALPKFVDVAVPVGLLWMSIWYPGRGSLAALGSVLAVLGVTLVLRSITRAKPSAGDVPETDTAQRRRDRSGALGVALSLVKPQFGLPIVAVAIAGGRLRDVWRGILALILVSAPMLVVLSIAAGSPLALVQSVLRDVEHANSADSPSGFSSPFQRRIDLPGMLARYGLDNPSVWVTVGIPLLMLLIAIVAIRLSRNPLWVSTVVCTSVLLGLFHAPYDLLLMFIPVAIGIGMAIRGELSTVAAKLALAASVLVVIHLHTVTIFLIPGMSVGVADTVDAALLLVALISALYGCVAAHRRGAQAGATTTTTTAPQGA